jgi:hypothetical protein
MIERTLPTSPGFFWWRQTAEADWRMIQVVDFGGDFSGPQHLTAYDVMFGSFGGRGLRYWEPHSPVGEWVKVKPPPAQDKPAVCELTECPFCGGDGLWKIKEDDKDEGWVECSICHARGPRAQPHQLATYYWNRRRP